MSSLTEDADRQLLPADCCCPLYFFVVLTAVEVNPPFSLILHSVRSDLLCSNSTEATNIIPGLHQSE